VYLNGIGGAAQYYARTVEKVLDVNLLEFGIPEAMWHLGKRFRGDRHDGCARQQFAR
jgi:tartrate dehydratase beta subunit/fumarate hydratase class I family protein